jgi:hypothetical protein
MLAADNIQIGRYEIYTELKLLGISLNKIKYYKIIIKGFKFLVKQV